MEKAQAGMKWTLEFDNQLHKYKEFTKVNSNFSSNICRKFKMYSAGDVVTLTDIFVWKYGTHC